jgi:hypothetical protein
MAEMRRSLAFRADSKWRRYNVCVVTPQPNPNSRLVPSPAKQRGRKAEAIGILIVALIVLIITLARYWHNIAWSAR